MVLDSRISTNCLPLCDGDAQEVILRAQCQDFTAFFLMARYLSKVALTLRSLAIDLKCVADRSDIKTCCVVGRSEERWWPNSTHMRMCCLMVQPKFTSAATPSGGRPHPRSKGSEYASVRISATVKNPRLLRLSIALIINHVLNTIFPLLPSTLQMWRSCPSLACNNSLIWGQGARSSKLYQGHWEPVHSVFLNYSSLTLTIKRF